MAAEAWLLATYSIDVTKSNINIESCKTGKTFENVVMICCTSFNH